MMTITKDQFQAYEDVRSSGVINMYELGMVSSLSGIDTMTIIEIMNQYEELMKLYPDIRNGGQK